jgi:hypothetical protein
VPRTGVAGALPLLHAFSYDVSGKIKQKHLKYIQLRIFILPWAAYKVLVYVLLYSDQLVNFTASINK